jgi:penicillin-binding protein 2
LPNPAGATLISHPAEWDVINEGMRAVIVSGTGKLARLNDGFPYLIAGKSGTAERFSRTSEAYDTNKSKAHLAARHRAWFEAYTPADDPHIAAAVVLEAGAWGAEDAGPIVRKIFDSWLSSSGGDIPGVEHLPVNVTPSAPATSASVPQANPPDSEDDNGGDVEDEPAQATSGAQP